MPAKFIIQLYVLLATLATLRIRCLYKATGSNFQVRLLYVATQKA